MGGSRCPVDFSEECAISTLNDVASEDGFAERTHGEPCRAAGRKLGSCGRCPLAEQLRDGDQLTAVVLEAKLTAGARAFALCCRGGDGMMTWGEKKNDSDTSNVQGQLRDVMQVQTTDYAFAEILGDGLVVTWGHNGGDSSQVQHRFWGVQQIQATHCAFATIRADGSVVTWGDPDRGGDSSAVQHQLRDVRQVQGNDGACAAVLADGSVVTWGRSGWGGDGFPGAEHQVQQIQGRGAAFVAILQGSSVSSVVAWGNPYISAGSAHRRAAASGHKRSQKVHFLQFGPTDPLIPGAMKTRAVTALRSSIYLKVCSRFRAQSAPWRSSTDRLLPGAIQTMAVTAPQPNCSLGRCSRFRPHAVHLLRSWQMVRLSPGAVQSMAVIALKCDVS